MKPEKRSRPIPGPLGGGVARVLVLSVAFAAAAVLAPAPAGGQSVARTWNEQNLVAIRIDFPNPAVHARNLFHTSAAMWDAWAAYDPVAVGYLHREAAAAADLAAARHEAISYAAYRVLSHRYAKSVNAAETQLALDAQMDALGYPTGLTTTEGGSAAAVGNRVAATVIGYFAADGANEEFNYIDRTYEPVNEPLVLAFPGTEMVDPNRWQPLEFVLQISQNGQVLDSTVQVFIGSQWGKVRPFALHGSPGEALFIDPGQPPLLGGADDAAFKAGSVEVIRYSSLLHPDGGVVIDVSPGTIGNNPLGTNDGAGYRLNPLTGVAYSPNPVREADFGRVVAEFWADGPDSETPPGHWNSLANKVVDHPGFGRRLGGDGPEIDPLEWDVKLYFALNGAVPAAAVAAWDCKRHYDYVRPISSIRYMGGLGQSSDPGGPSYHPDGLPLVDGLIEVVTPASSAPGERHEHLDGNIGEVAIFAWGGEPANPEIEYTGARWIVAIDWLPYQRDTFVTPAFAGYISGHSTFSRAAAEVLTRMTGSPYFPGGLGRHTVPAGALEFESGPSEDVELQWATYYDAADQAGISRLYGGIHVPVDDGPGRVVGSLCGTDAWELARRYFDGSILTDETPVAIARVEADTVRVEWFQHRGLYYRVQSGDDPRAFSDVTAPARATKDRGTHSFTIPEPFPRAQFYRVVRSLSGEAAAAP